MPQFRSKLQSAKIIIFEFFCCFRPPSQISYIDKCHSQFADNRNCINCPSIEFIKRPQSNILQMHYCTLFDFAYRCDKNWEDVSMFINFSYLFPYP